MARGRARRTNHNPRNQHEDHRVGVINDVAEFEDFRNSILPKLQQMLQSGADDEEILNWAKSFAAARLASIVLADADNGRALAAIKDLLDRTRGKARETKDVTHRLAQMDDKQLDALLQSELIELEAMDETTEDEP